LRLAIEGFLVTLAGLPTARRGIFIVLEDFLSGREGNCFAIMSFSKSLDSSGCGAVGRAFENLERPRTGEVIGEAIIMIFFSSDSISDIVKRP
jgi:hypothetical protein